MRPKINETWILVDWTSFLVNRHAMPQTNSINFLNLQLSWIQNTHYYSIPTAKWRIFLVWLQFAAIRCILLSSCHLIKLINNIIVHEFQCDRRPTCASIAFILVLVWRERERSCVVRLCVCRLYIFRRSNFSNGKNKFLTNILRITFIDSIFLHSMCIQFDNRITFFLSMWCSMTHSKCFGFQFTHSNTCRLDVKRIFSLLTLIKYNEAIMDKFNGI